MFFITSGWLFLGWSAVWGLEWIDFRDFLATLNHGNLYLATFTLTGPRTLVWLIQPHTKAYASSSTNTFAPAYFKLQAYIGKSLAPNFILCSLYNLWPPGDTLELHISSHFSPRSTIETSANATYYIRNLHRYKKINSLTCTQAYWYSFVDSNFNNKPLIHQHSRCDYALHLLTAYDKPCPSLYIKNSIYIVSHTLITMHIYKQIKSALNCSQLSSSLNKSKPRYLLARNWKYLRHTIVLNIHLLRLRLTLRNINSHILPSTTYKNFSPSGGTIPHMFNHMMNPYTQAYDAYSHTPNCLNAFAIVLITNFDERLSPYHIDHTLTQPSFYCIILIIESNISHTCSVNIYFSVFTCSHELYFLTNKLIYNHQSVLKQTVSKRKNTKDSCLYPRSKTSCPGEFSAKSYLNIIRMKNEN